MIIHPEHPFQGTATNCAVATLGSEAVVEEISPLECRVAWDHEGYSGFATDVSLRCGIDLCVWEGRAERGVSLTVDGSPTNLMFILSRGTGITNTVNGGPSILAGGGVLEIVQIKRPVTMTSSLLPGAHNAFVVLALTPQRMSELLGVAALPAVVRKIVASEDAYCREAVPMGATLFRLLDEMLACAAAGFTRQLYLEGKGLELLAKIFEELTAQEQATGPALSPRDVQRLAKVKEALLARLNDPPALSELARQVGLNETKLKAAFRMHFGVPIYSYLRDRRMAEAHRLLRERNLNVTEVATQVGYTNPSKFASAFRKHFGVTPSSVVRVSPGVADEHVTAQGS